MTQLPVDETQHGRPGRPRSEQAERAIIEATLDLLAEVGIAGTSIEQVALRAGVGKATIYRRWASKEALIIDAAGTLKPPIPELSGRTVREDLLEIAAAARKSSLDSRDNRVFRCLFGEAHQHPELYRRYYEAIVEPRREVVRNVLRRGIASGELRDDMDLEVMLVIVTSPIIHHGMMLKHRGEDMSAAFAEQLIDAALDGMRPRS